MNCDGYTLFCTNPTRKGFLKILYGGVSGKNTLSVTETLFLVDKILNTLNKSNVTDIKNRHKNREAKYL